MCVRVSQNLVQRVSFRHQLNKINEVSIKMSAASLYMGENFLGILHRNMSYSAGDNAN